VDGRALEPTTRSGPGRLELLIAGCWTRNLDGVEPLSPSAGWGVLHLFYRVDRALADRAAFEKAIAEFCADPDAQVVTSATIGHKADLGVLAIAPDLTRLQQLQRATTDAGFDLITSYFSVTELSEYGMTEDDERARLASEGLDADAIEAALVPWRERIEHYREQRIHPRLPERRFICFYPMSKRRSGDDNWYSLSFEERKILMAGHARVGRSYAGRVLQLITGSTGLDDFEWGVTLLADDPLAIKDIVYEMRFDEVSARYAEFGWFITGIVGTPADVLDQLLE